MELIIFTLFLSIVVGILGRKTYLGFWANFIFSLFFTPLVPLVYILIASYKTKENEAVKLATK